MSEEMKLQSGALSMEFRKRMMREQFPNIDCDFLVRFVSRQNEQHLNYESS